MSNINRKAFTLVELLVVIGIIIILIGILLPVVTRMRRSAQITGQQLDFQTISSALESYKADFGDYPRNQVLPTWNTYQLNGSPLVNAPVHLSLAAALLGSGPQVTQEPGVTNISQYEVGDGADGLGFRAQTTNYSTGTTASGTTGAVAFSVPSKPQLTSQPYTVPISFGSSSAGQALQAQLNNFIPAGQPNQTYGSITMSTGTIYEETVGFVVNFQTNSGELILTSQPVFPNQHQASNNTPPDNYVIKLATGKVTPNYISPDTFKVAVVPMGVDLRGNSLGGPPGQTILPGPVILGPAGEQLLLDRWGQVIQYFPRYGPASNRMNDSVWAPLPSGVTTAMVQAGPLDGYSQPKSVDSEYGENAMYDLRDGAPFYANNSLNSPDESWVLPPTQEQATTFRPDFTLQWMLGDTINPTTGNFQNVIVPPNRLTNDVPFILISAGPDGPNRVNGGYCNFVNTSTGTLTDPASGNQLTQAQLLQMFLNSGNVYNFDHP
jgi:type II secretory pathway pseudopilin PulG